jgi:ABC-type methionine transport system ATPase subunit
MVIRPRLEREELDSVVERSREFLLLELFSRTRPVRQSKFRRLSDWALTLRSVMIFDEATSALDTKTEKEIQKSLQEVSRGRTTIVIAHRLSTIVDADEILVLKNGEVAERGSHFDLLEKRGEYYSMWIQQTADENPQEKQSPVSKEEPLISI